MAISATSTATDGVYRPSPLKANGRVRWTDDRLADLDAAIVAAAEAEHPVTLRGVYYRVVSAGAVDKTDAGYQRVGRQLLKLRRPGVVPYRWITDGTRWITKPTTWSSMAEKLEWEQANYRRALWHDTPDEVLFFTEKDAISGVVLPVTAQWDVPLGVLRGYCSESFAHSVAIGDLNPTVAEWVTFERLAVTPDQIDELGLPTRSTKRSDTRAKGFAGGSVEVDAIPAPTLRQIVDDAITRHVDPHHLEVTRTVEEEERRGFARLAETFGRPA